MSNRMPRMGNDDTDITPSMQRIIWFIRHGESEANAGLATCDPEFADLTFTGQQQARSIATICKDAPSLIIVSRYQRTTQTAMPTLEKFTMASEIWDVHEFTYLAQLHGQMTTRQERSPHVDTYWRKPDPEYVDSVGSESFVEFFLRTQRVVNQLLSMHERFIMVFSHEQFITAARWILVSGKTYKRTDITPDMMSSFRYALVASPIPNGAILPVLVQHNNVECGDVSTAHLR